jgi:hypothetical protein
MLIIILVLEKQIHLISHCLKPMTRELYLDARTALRMLECLSSSGNIVSIICFEPIRHNIIVGQQCTSAQQDSTSFISN